MAAAARTCLYSLSKSKIIINKWRLGSGRGGAEGGVGAGVQLLLLPPCAPDPAATVVTVAAAAPDFADAPDPAVASDPTPLLPLTCAGLAVTCACSAYGGAAAVAAAAAGACAAAAAAATRTGPLSTARTCSCSHQSCHLCWPVCTHSCLYWSFCPGPIVHPCSCWSHDVIVVTWLCTL